MSAMERIEAVRMALEILARHTKGDITAHQAQILLDALGLGISLGVKP